MAWQRVGNAGPGMARAMPSVVAAKHGAGFLRLTKDAVIYRLRGGGSMNNNNQKGSEGNKWDRRLLLIAVFGTLLCVFCTIRLEKDRKDLPLPAASRDDLNKFATERGMYYEINSRFGGKNFDVIIYKRPNGPGIKGVFVNVEDKYEGHAIYMAMQDAIDQINNPLNSGGDQSQNPRSR